MIDLLGLCLFVNCIDMLQDAIKYESVIACLIGRDNWQRRLSHLQIQI